MYLLHSFKSQFVTDKNIQKEEKKQVRLCVCDEEFVVLTALKKASWIVVQQLKFCKLSTDFLDIKLTTITSLVLK